MDINVVSGVGTGKTVLSAFDSALKDAGVLNYNLIQLSSVIPPNSKIVKPRHYETPKNEYGHKLYVVKAEMRSNEVGKYLAAGIGWYQFGRDNRGVFVEHELISDTKIAAESEIKFRIKNSLRDLCKNRFIKFDESRVGSMTSIVKVELEPTCTLVLAVYESEKWRT